MLNGSFPPPKLFMDDDTCRCGHPRREHYDWRGRKSDHPGYECFHWHADANRFCRCEAFEKHAE